MPDVYSAWWGLDMGDAGGGREEGRGGGLTLCV